MVRGSCNLANTLFKLTIKLCTGTSAFSVLMEGAKVLWNPNKPSLPSEITNIKTRKHQLRNDFLHFMEERKLMWPEKEVSNVGEVLVQSLVDVLWYIDGHHNTFNERSCKIPPLFEVFCGYNVPQIHKHRKRSIENLSSVILTDYSNKIFRCLQLSYWEREVWKEFKPEVEMLAKSLHDYASYLRDQNKKMKLVHCSGSPIRSISENITVQVIPVYSPTPIIFNDLEIALSHKNLFEYVLVENFCPADPRKKYEYLKLLSSGLSVRTVKLTYSHGNNIGNLNFIWKIPIKASEKDILSQSQQVIETCKQEIPTFHTRFMRKTLYSKYGRVAPSMKLSVLRSFYKELSGDQSSSANEHEEEIDRRVNQMLEMEDPDIIIDLRELNCGRKSQYDVFWEECKKFIQERVGAAVDDRRHSCVMHMACAISVRDLIEQVRARCPNDTKVPCTSWVQLQFWPKTIHAKSKIHYTGRLNIKFMVQARQFRKSHVDAHYASAVFRYQREMAVQFKEYSNFVCLDDKHRIKVGEPKFPVAAAERGRRVLVSRGTAFEVGDHDFSVFSLIPSVCFLVDIPNSVELSWYTGSVIVGLKEAAFEASSPQRHCKELYDILYSKNLHIQPILFLYTDGGPDHRLTFLSVQLSLINLFLALDLDFLCAARTAPFHSWRNPVERIMSILNLGLQSVGLMRTEMSPEYEACIKNLKSLSQVRSMAEKKSFVRDETVDSVQSAKVLLSEVFQRLQLKEKNFEVFTPASLSDIGSFSETIKLLDSTASLDITKASMTEYQGIKRFYDHCCQVRHYSFCIKKCGQDSCSLCKPVRMPRDMFDQISFLPDPVPQSDGHYKEFKEVFGTETTESHRPSLQKRLYREKSVPFPVTAQHAKNTNIVVQCEECGMWRIVYSKYKLSNSELDIIQSILDNYSYTCGSSMADLNLCGKLSTVCIRIIHCYEPLEIHYYSLNHELLCVYCCNNKNLITNSDNYPQCNNCLSKPPIKRRK